MEKIAFQDTVVVLRPYDFEKDPPKLVRHLFTEMNSEKGIAELQAGDEFFKEDSKNRVRFVAEIEDELYATITLIRERWTNDQHKFGVYSVVTAENFQGTGLSQLLFHYVCRWAKEQGGRLLLNSTWEDNHQARKYYEKIGFKQYGVLPKGLMSRKSMGFVDQIFYYYDLDWLE